MENLCHYISLDNLEKAHVKSYERKSKTGKLSQVKEHEDKRQKKQEGDKTKEKEDFLENINWPHEMLSDYESRKFSKLFDSKEYKFSTLYSSLDSDRDESRFNNKLKKIKKEGWKILAQNGDHHDVAILIYKKKKEQNKNEKQPEAKIEKKENKTDNKQNFYEGQRVKVNKNYGGESGKFVEQNGNYIILKMKDGRNKSFHISDIKKSNSNDFEIIDYIKIN